MSTNRDAAILEALAVAVSSVLARAVPGYAVTDKRLVRDVDRDTLDDIIEIRFRVQCNQESPVRQAPTRFGQPVERPTQQPPAPAIQPAPRARKRGDFPEIDL